MPSKTSSLTTVRNWLQSGMKTVLPFLNCMLVWKVPFVILVEAPNTECLSWSKRKVIDSKLLQTTSAKSGSFLFSRCGRSTFDENNIDQADEAAQELLFAHDSVVIVCFLDLLLLDFFHAPMLRSIPSLKQFHPWRCDRLWLEVMMRRSPVRSSNSDSSLIEPL